MSMDKRWGQMFARLDGIESELKKLNERETIEAVLEVGFDITKEELMAIKGVGSSTADAILELLNSK